jgi:hypothetical protein
MLWKRKPTFHYNPYWFRLGNHYIMLWRRRTTFHCNPYWLLLDIQYNMIWRRKPTFHYKPYWFLSGIHCKTRSGGGGPTFIRILIDFDWKFNAHCFAGRRPTSITTNIFCQFKAMMIKNQQSLVYVILHVGGPRSMNQMKKHKKVDYVGGVSIYIYICACQTFNGEEPESQWLEAKVMSAWQDSVSVSCCFCLTCPSRLSGRLRHSGLRAVALRGITCT